MSNSYAVLGLRQVVGKKAMRTDIAGQAGRQRDEGAYYHDIGQLMEGK